MFRKCLAIFIITTLILGITPSKLFLNALAAGDTSNLLMEVPSGYIGIYSAKDLFNVRNNLSSSYILMNDIDLTGDMADGGLYFNNGTGWEPIGNSTTPFTGNFDGNGHKIIGLKMSIQSSQFIYAGLFGYAKNAKIANLGMENDNIYAENTSLDSTTSNVYAGGIVGYGYNVTITNSYNTGTVSAPSLFNGYAGGIAGYVNSSYNLYSTISNSNNTGSIYAKTAAGGVAGKTYQTNISNVYNKGTFTDQASRYAGGIVGDLNSNSTVSNAYNIGNINFSSLGGGIAGSSFHSSISNSYNQGELSSTGSSSRGGGIVGTASGTTISKSYNMGKVSSSAQYSVGGGITGTLGSNSSVADSYNMADISVDLSVGGIAGDITNGVIIKSYNTGSMSGDYAGGMIGWSSSGTILDSFNIGSIKGKYDSGGMAGYSTNTTIKNAYNVGSVITTSYYPYPFGGIAGEFDGSIENSYYLDNVQNGVGKGLTVGTYQKTFDQMKDPSTYEGFNFSTTWKFDGATSFQLPSFSQTPGTQTEGILNISMSSLPGKVTLVQGDALDLTRAAITIRTNHGNQSTTAVSEDMVTGYDPNKTGYQLIKVSYEGQFTYFNVIVKAKYTVTFKDYDGSILKTEPVIEGESATAPKTPIRAGYTFIGWSSNINSVKSNLTVTAQYNINSYIVTYMDEDSVLNSEGYNSDVAVTRPTDPIKPGYTFLDWYADQDLQTRYPFFNTLNKNIILYAKFAKTPTAPQSLTVGIAGFDKLKIAWNQVSGVDGYEIQRATSTNGNYNYMYILGANYQSYIVDSLQTNSTYYFKIRSYRIVDGQYIYSSLSPVVNNKPILAGISSVKAVPTGFDKATVSWAKSAEASGYEIFRATSSIGTYSQVGTITNGSTLSYTNSSLSTGTTYFYKVRAYRTVDGKKVYSTFSSTISAKPILAAITSAKAVSGGYNKIKINWSLVSGATGYEMYRSTSKTGIYSNIKTITSGSTISYLDSGLTPGKTFFYKVRAYRTIGGTKVYNPFPVLSAPFQL